MYYANVAQQMEFMRRTRKMLPVDTSIDSKLGIERWYQGHLNDIAYLYNKRRGRNYAK